MFIYLITAIKYLIESKKFKLARPAIVIFAFTLILLGITVPNTQPADALFFIPIIMIAAGGLLLNAAAGDPTGVATAVLDTAGSAVGGVAVGAVTGLLELILDLLRQFSGWLITLSGQFLTFVLIDFNQSVGFYTNSMVTAGWGVVRDVANWFFIIMLIVIAIGTILGQEQYGMRRNLLRLILVAIFMNFSLVFVAIYINVTQLFMGFFIRTMTSPFQDIGKAIAFQGFAYGAFQGYNPAGTEQIVKLANLLFISLFQFVGAFVLLFISILLIIRIAQLWLHMIIAPLAFVSTIIPKTQQFFGHWLSGLINWGLFGVIASFFLWLSTYLLAYMLQDYGADDIKTVLVGADGTAPLIQMGHLFLRFVVISLFLFASIGYAKSMSGRAGNMVSNGIMSATGMAAAPGLAAGAIAARGGRRVAARELAVRSAEKREQAAKFLENRIPFVGGTFAKPIRTSLARGSESIDKYAKEFQDEKTILGKEKFVQSLTARFKNNNFIGNKEQQVAAIQELQKAGVDTSTLVTEKNLGSLFKYAEVVNREKSLAAANPELVRKIKGLNSVEEVATKYQLAGPAQAPFLTEAAFKNPDFQKFFFANASGNTVGRVIEAGHAVPALKDAINALSANEDLLREMVGKNTALFSYFARNPAAAAAGINSERIFKALERLGSENPTNRSSAT